MKTINQNTHQTLLKLVKTERKIQTEVLDHLQIINEKKIFLNFGHDSLLRYCVKELGYSESAAYRRIKAVRATSELPELKKEIHAGNLNLSQISQAQGLFENYKKETKTKIAKDKKLELFNQIKCQSSFNSEKILRTQLGLKRKKRIITIEVEDDTYQAWVEFKGKMIHKNYSDEKLFLSLLEKTTMPPKKRLRKVSPIKKSRHQSYVSAKIKKELLEKAKHCQMQNCKSTYGLEIDHIRPISQNGQSNRENLRVLCRHHNQWRT
jgi:hypothetical protein